LDFNDRVGQHLVDLGINSSVAKQPGLYPGKST
jgi:hypothetical protein